MTTPTSLREIARHALGEIAPEAPLSTQPGNELLLEALDLDSFDFLTFVQAIDDATGVDVPAIDSPRMATLDGVVAYLVQRAVSEA